MLKLQSSLLDHTVEMHSELSEINRKLNKQETLTYYAEYVGSLYNLIINNVGDCTSWIQFMDNHILKERKELCKSNILLRRNTVN